jgi:hypothetical protein
MEFAEKNMIYKFYNKRPINSKYIRGICRIWPVDQYGTYFKDPSPYEADGVFSVLPPEVPYKEDIPKETSSFVKAMEEAMKKLKLTENLSKRGNRKWIANDRIIKQWRLHRRIACGR